MRELYGYKDSHGNIDENLTRKKLFDIVDLRLDILLGDIEIKIWRMK